MNADGESARNWTITYVAVMASEVIWLAALWWLGRTFGT
jgi:hypothetical protein